MLKGIFDGFFLDRDVGVREQAQALRAQHVEVAVADLLEVAEHGVEVVVHRQVAAREASAVAGGEPQDQLDGLLRVGAAAVVELVERPSLHVRLVGRRRLVGGDVSDDADGEQAGMHAEHADAVAAVSWARFSVSLIDRRLGDRVGRDERPTVSTGLAGDVDDPAATGAPPCRAGRAGWPSTCRAGSRRSSSTRRPGRSPTAVRSGPSDPGVVDEQVDRSELRSRRPRDRGGQRAGVGDVGGGGGGGAAGRLDRGRRCAASSVGGAGDQPDRGAGLGEGDGDNPADASAAAGDEGDRCSPVGTVARRVGRRARWRGVGIAGGAVVECSRRCPWSGTVRQRRPVRPEHRCSSRRVAGVVSTDCSGGARRA